MSICPEEQIRIHDEALVLMCSLCNHQTVDCIKSCEDYKYHMDGIKRAKDQLRRIK